MTDRAHLETPFVFIDTQAYVANAFDWHGIHLGKLASLCADGTLKLLITSITRREVLRKIEEGLDEAIERVKKHKTALRNAGLDTDLLEDRSALLANATDRFRTFLRITRAIDIPLEAAIDVVFDDYFTSRPPFSKRKPKEFPDAFVTASLVAWLHSSGTSAYVVSGDGDFAEVCELYPSLIHAKSISEVISRASVSAQIHAALARELDDSLTVKDKLADRLVGLTVRTPKQWPRYATGRVRSATVLGIMNMDVLDSASPSFACELEFEAELKISAEVFDETEPLAPHSYAIETTVERSFTAIVEVLFDPSGRGLSVESVFTSRNDVELHLEDL